MGLRRELGREYAAAAARRTRKDRTCFESGLARAIDTGLAVALRFAQRLTGQEPGSDGGRVGGATRGGAT